jgi:hypothetical protein
MIKRKPGTFVSNGEEGLEAKNFLLASNSFFLLLHGFGFSLLSSQWFCSVFPSLVAVSKLLASLDSVHFILVPFDVRP